MNESCFTTGISVGASGGVLYSASELEPLLETSFLTCGKGVSLEELDRSLTGVSGTSVS